MYQMDNTNDLRRYDYGDYTPLTSRCEQIKEYLDEKLDGIDSEHISTTIRDSVNENMDDIKQKICHTDCHIENAKDEIINDIKHTDCHIENAKDEIINDIKHKICHTNCHIENAKDEIIEKVEQGKSQCAIFHAETKEAIADAIDNINRYTDDKFDKIDFETKFSDLNKQIKSFNNLNLGEHSNE